MLIHSWVQCDRQWPAAGVCGTCGGGSLFHAYDTVGRSLIHCTSCNHSTIHLAKVATRDVPRHKTNPIKTRRTANRHKRECKSCGYIGFGKEFRARRGNKNIVVDTCKSCRREKTAESRAAKALARVAGAHKSFTFSMAG